MNSYNCEEGPESREDEDRRIANDLTYFAKLIRAFKAGKLAEEGGRLLAEDDRELGEPIENLEKRFNGKEEANE